MQANVLTAVALPAALAVIMLGLGLSLTLDDFKRIVVYPKAVAVGLACQMLLLPFVCFGIARAFALPPELAVGLMLLAASPGGATANLFSHLARGDVALNITLTALNSLLSLFTLPIVVNLSLLAFMGDGKVIPLQFAKVAQVFAIVLVPVTIGMAIKAKRPALAARMDKPVRALSALVLLLVVGAAVYKERAKVVEYFQLVGGAALAFNLASLAVGYFFPRMARLEKKQSIAIGMEIGIHNGTLAIAIAASPLLLNNGMMAVPPAIYSLIMFFTAAAFGFLVNASSRTAPAPSPSQMA